MGLNEGSMNKTYTVNTTNLPIKLEKRLEALGMIQGTEVTLLNKKKNGAVIVKIRGTRFAIGNGIASKIYVS